MRRNYYRALVDSTERFHLAPTVVPLKLSQQLISRFDSPSEFLCARGAKVEIEKSVDKTEMWVQVNTHDV